MPGEDTPDLALLLRQCRKLPLAVMVCRSLRVCRVGACKIPSKRASQREHGEHKQSQFAHFLFHCSMINGIDNRIPGVMEM